MVFINYLLYFAIGYLFGSLPWSLIIGKVFYKVDIREHGSGNLGGTNAVRTLGKVPGFTVIILDVLKATIAVLIVSTIFKDSTGAIFAGAGTVIGHCYPIFANFKGGKAVATIFGYLLALAIVDGTILLFLVPLALFAVVLLIGKMVSLGALSGLTLASILSVFMASNYVSISIILMTVFSFYRHRENIKRIIKGNERKIKS